MDREGAPVMTRWHAMRALAYLVLAGGVVLYLGPFVIQVVTSFKTDADATANPVSLVPDPVTLDAWRTVAGKNPAVRSPVDRWLANSFIVTISVALSQWLRRFFFVHTIEIWPWAPIYVAIKCDSRHCSRGVPCCGLDEARPLPHR